MREKPTISVIIPCYNVSKWIDRCLESIVSQTIGLECMEIICVDDCSEDDTFLHLQSWEKRYPDHFIVIQSPENRRIGGARNIALSYASGDWVAYVDSDDWVERDYLEILMEPATEGTYDVICCSNMRDSNRSLVYFSEDVRKGEGEAQEVIISSVSERKKLIHSQAMTLLAWSKLIRKDFLMEHEIIFPENLAYEDIIWGELLHLYAERIFIGRMRLYHYFINPEATVLGRASAYHPDMLTIHSRFYHEVRRRGLDTEYETELEYEYLYTGLLAFLKILALRFEEPPYSLFLLLQAFTEEHYPNLRDNYYVKRDGLPPVHDNLLQAAFMPLRKKEFLELMASLKKIGI